MKTSMCGIALSILRSTLLDLLKQSIPGRKHYRLLEQIEAASTSIAMNLAEGKGRNSKKEFIQFCYIARGSMYETMTLLEIFRRKNWITGSAYPELEQEGIKIASITKGLINSLHES